MSRAWGNPCPKGNVSENFSWSETACRCCRRVANLEAVRATARMMEEIREKLGGRIIYVNSWCRCPAHNKAVGGANESLHLIGFAVDFTVPHASPRAVWEALNPEWSGGLGRYPGFTHIDRGNKRRWSG